MTLSQVPISHVASQVRGVTYAKDDAIDSPKPGYVMLLRANNISNAGLGLDDVVYVPVSRVSIKQRLIPGDIIIATSSGSLDVVGKAAQVTTPVDATFGAFCKVVRPNENIDHSYLANFFQTARYRLKISSLAAGANINNLRNEHIDNLELPLPYKNGKPDLDEQKRIAAILDKAGAIRRKRQQALRLSDDFLRSVFLEMFGDPVTNPKGWDVKPLNKLGNLDRGVSKHRPRNDPSLLDGPYPLVQTGDVANSHGYIRRHSSTYSERGLRQSKLWLSGTLCITIAANIANTGILTYDACFPDSVVGFIPNDTSTVEYVQSLLGFFRKILDDGASQVAQKNINLRVLRELQVPCPPIEMQSAFSSLVNQTNKIRSSVRLANEDANSAYAALQQRAFRGEL